MVSTYTAKPTKFDGRSYNEGSFDISQIFINNTGLNLVVVNANGTHVIVEPAKDIKHHSDGLTILLNYKASPKAKINSLGYLTDDTLQENLTNEAFHQKLYAKYRIPTDEILKTRTGLYVQNLDIFVSVYNGHTVPKHPRHADSIHQFVDNYVNSAITVNVIIIDNYKLLGEPYVCLGGEPVRVTPTRKMHLTDGVYVIRSVLLPDGERNTTCKRYDLTSDTNPIKFYNSYTEALTRGDELGEMKRQHDLLSQQLKNEGIHHQSELASLKSQLEIEKSERDRVQKDAEHRRDIQNERHKSELDARAQEIDAQKREIEHLRNLESIRSKDYYERRSSERKDSSELLKIIPAVITFVTFMVTMVNKGK